MKGLRKIRLRGLRLNICKPVYLSVLYICALSLYFYVCSNLESKLNSKLRRLEEEEISVRVKNQTLIAECEAKSKRLDLLHCNLYKNTQDMSDILSNFSTVSDYLYIFKKFD